jgi:hypothetical protein
LSGCTIGGFSRRAQLHEWVRLHSRILSTECIYILFTFYYQSNAYVKIMKSRNKTPELQSVNLQPEPGQIDPPCLGSIRDYLYSVVSWWAAKCVGSTVLWIVYWINVFLFLTNGANHVRLLFVLFPYWLTSTLENFKMAPVQRFRTGNYLYFDIDVLEHGPYNSTVKWNINTGILFVMVSWLQRKPFVVRRNTTTTSDRII